MNKLAWFIRAWEGCVLTPYLDVAGKCTIGVGHLMNEDDPREPITEADAMALLDADLTQVAADVSELVTVPLAQHQLDALTSFAFNLGTQALKDSTLLRLVNLWQLDAAGYEFQKWNKAHVNGVLQAVAGLMKRRAAERAMFLTGDYSGHP